MRVVLDTNILLVAVPLHLPYRVILDGLFAGDYEACVTTEILFEYEEVLLRKFGAQTAKDILRVLLLLPNVRFTTVFYRWNLIRQDADDNKIVDCAIASGADYIVTNDRHFDSLRSLDFPVLRILRIDEFMALLP